MLRHAHIRDFVIVEQLDIDFEQGMTVVTGETGAGKSILIGALGAALGDKVDAQKIRTGAEQAEIVLTFDLGAASAARGWLDEQALAAEDECMVRRLIGRDGRSRAFINGRPVPLQALRQLGERLLDIHGQHAHQSLLRLDAQRELLDDFSGSGALLNELCAVYQAWKTAGEQLENLELSTHEHAAQRELMRYQLDELEALRLGETELGELNEEHLRLANMHRLMEGAQRLVDELYEQEGMAVLSRLAHAVSEIGQLEALDARLRGAAVLLREATIPIEEASAELRHYLSQLDADPARLAWVEQRLAQIQGLARKHRLAPEQLLALQEQLRGQLDAWQQDATQLTELRARLAQHEQRYRLLAGQLRELRRQGARQLEEWVSTDIQHLGLSGGRFVVSFQLLERFSPSGLDRIEFSAVTNPGQPLLPLAKVASGGELSRISLALQVASAQTARIPTLMFDEVDVGIGGRVAEIVGQKLLTLALNRQVLCITHLPQVAALGQQHLQVSKRVTGDSTRADIHYLAAEARVAELARMSGGVEITHQTLAHARDLLARGQRQVHS